MTSVCVLYRERARLRARLRLFLVLLKLREPLIIGRKMNRTPPPPNALDRSIGLMLAEC